MKTKIWEDPIVAEVRKVKERLAAKFDFDVVAMLRAQQQREKTSGRHDVDLSRSSRKPGRRQVAHASS
jgi:hypothetical protein